MEPTSSFIPIDITKVEFEKEIGIQEITAEEQKGLKEANTSKVASQAIANVVNFSLRDKETSSPRVASYDLSDFAGMALTKVVRNVPLERTSNGMVVLKPKDPLIAAKTHFLVAMHKDQIIKELESTAKNTQFQNEAFDLPITKDFDAVDLLDFLKANGYATQAEIDQAVGKVIGKQFDHPNAQVMEGITKFTDSPKYMESLKAFGMMEEYLKVPEARVKFLNTHVIDKTKFILAALREGYFNKAGRLFKSLPRTDRVALAAVLAKEGINQHQMSQFSITVENEASRSHAPSEVPTGQSPDKFWKELEQDRQALFTAFQAALKHK